MDSILEKKLFKTRHKRKAIECKVGYYYTNIDGDFFYVIKNNGRILTYQWWDNEFKTAWNYSKYGDDRHFQEYYFKNLKTIKSIIKHGKLPD